MTPRPLPRHQHTTMQIAQWLQARLGPALVALVDVEIGLYTGDHATHRAPDVTVTMRSVLSANRPWMQPSDALLVVEVVSPAAATSTVCSRFTSIRPR